MYGNCGSNYCEPEAWSENDQKALLQERAAILEAKLATVRHWIENLDKRATSKDK